MLNYKRILGLIYREVVNFVVESFFLRQPGEANRPLQLCADQLFATIPMERATNSLRSVILSFDFKALIPICNPW